MLSLLIVILMMVALFRLTGFLFHVIGRMLGGILGIFGWMILAALAVSVFGIAMFILPIIIVVGITALISAATS
jgi:hypothetical protein